ncbi:MAG: hypothetical protein FJX78_05520 [Armatimonadetes bacterium]|nr:hypothetical protein [Armatimonadota bacterium]
MTARDCFGVGFVLVGVASLLAGPRSAAAYYALAEDYVRRWPFQILPRWFIVGQWLVIGVLFVVFGVLLLTVWRTTP